MLTRAVVVASAVLVLGLATLELSCVLASRRGAATVAPDGGDAPARAAPGPPSASELAPSTGPGAPAVTR